MSNGADVWDDEFVGHSGTHSSTHPAVASSSNSKSRTNKSKAAPRAVVPDDWELDDNDNDDAGGGGGGDTNTPISVNDVERTKRLWEDHHTKEPAPMPSLIISRGSSTSAIPTSLPLNQPPTMKILKRPSPSSSPSQNSANSMLSSQSIKEREARYQAARERIFGEIQTAACTTTTNVVRDPRGPPPTSDVINGKVENKGFNKRIGKPASSAAMTTTTPQTFDT